MSSLKEALNNQKVINKLGELKDDYKIKCLTWHQRLFINIVAIVKVIVALPIIIIHTIQTRKVNGR